MDKQVTVEIIGTTIKMTCSTADDLHTIVSRFLPWTSEGLLINGGDLYVYEPRRCYTRGYFNKYFK